MYKLFENLKILSSLNPRATGKNQTIEYINRPKKLNLLVV